MKINGTAIAPTPTYDHNFRVDVAKETTELSLSLTTADTNATVVVTVYGDQKQASAGIYTITLTGQNTTIMVEVTPPDGMSSEYYFITVARAP